MGEIKISLTRATCESLLLQFKEPLIPRGFNIPDAYHIYSLVVIAGKTLQGQIIDPIKVNGINTAHHYNGNRLNKEYFSMLSPRVYTGIQSSLKEAGDYYSGLENYLIWNQETIAYPEGVLTWGFKYGEGVFF